MLISLSMTAFLLGLAGVPHCAAMCGAACAVAFPRGVPLWSLLGRCLSYAVLGAIVAGSTSFLGQWGRGLAFLKPFWVMAQAAAFLLGAYLLVFGRMPPVLDGWGQKLYFAARSRLQARPFTQADLSTQPLMALLAGMAWALLPCGLLYAALTVAALAPNAWAGAVVMLVFALPGAVGVWAAPSLLRKLLSRARLGGAARPGRGPSNLESGVAPVLWFARGQAGVGAEMLAAKGTPVQEALPGFDPSWAIRLSGGMLVAMTSWALYHQILNQWNAWCA
jgi:uncharacterized protein